MERIPAFLFLLCALPLAGCGPREIGDGIPLADEEIALSEPPDHRNVMYRPSGVSLESRERLLYQVTSTEYMESYQKMHHDRLMRSIHGFHGNAKATVDPESPAYREIPRQRSPFRQ